MTEQDFPEVLGIEGDSFPSNPWTEQDFRNCLSDRENIGLVVTDYWSHQALGFCIYRRHKRYYELLSLAVHPHYRRRGLGKALLIKLCNKLCEKRKAILLHVRQTNLNAQLFFKACDFKAVKVLRRYYPDTREDAYRFRLFQKRVRVLPIHTRQGEGDR
jgi:ribosomal-protein-alanine N-acetyltransferase